MSVDYLDNLLFQKKHFPEIYKSYLDMGPEKPEGRRISVKKNVYLFFYLEEPMNIVRLIEELFCSDLQYSSSLSLCEVRFGFKNVISNSESGRVVFEINHPYLDCNKPLIFSKEVDYDILKESFAFYTYNAKPLRQLTELKIKRCCEYEYESHNLKNREDFLRCIYAMKPVYTFTVSPVLSQKEMLIKNSQQVEEVSLMVIQTINKYIELKEDDIIGQCSNKVLELFERESIEILSKHMKMEVFTHNFILLEEFFSYEKEFAKRIDQYFRNEILISIRDFKKIKNDYAVRYNAISGNKKILELNSFIERYLENFCKLLEDR